MRELLLWDDPIERLWGLERFRLKASVTYVIQYLLAVGGVNSFCFISLYDVVRRLCFGRSAFGTSGTSNPRSAPLATVALTSIT